MSQHHDTIGGVLGKAAIWIGAWFGTVTLANVQLWVSIVSGGLVGALAAVNLYKALRRKD